MRGYLLAFSAGIIAFQVVGRPPDAAMLAVLAIASALLFLRSSLRHPGAFLLGILWAAAATHHALLHRPAPQLTQQTVIVEGKIASIPEFDLRRVRFVFEPAKIEGADDNTRLPRRLLLSWYGNYGEIRAGETWRLPVRLRSPSRDGSSPDFDMARWLLAKRLDAVGHVVFEPQPQRLGSGASLHRVRADIGEMAYLAAEPPTTAGLLPALIVGDRQYMEPAAWEVLRRTGTAHLLAISGMHIGLVAAAMALLGMLVWRVVPAFNRRSSAAVCGAVVGMTGAFGYAALAGFSMPTQRALIMLVVACGALLARRSIAASHGVLIALAAVLLWDPFAPLSAGFWLSFGAVIIIIGLARHRLGHRRRWLELIRMQWLVSFAMMPAVIFWFQQAALTAPLANLVAIPLVSMFIVPTALSGALFLWLVPPLGEVLIDAAAGGLDWLMHGLRLLAEVTPSAELVQLPPLWALLLAQLGALLLVLPAGFPARLLALPMLLSLLIASPTQTEGESSHAREAVPARRVRLPGSSQGAVVWAGRNPSTEAIGGIQE